MPLGNTGDTRLCEQSLNSSLGPVVLTLKGAETQFLSFAGSDRQ
jgi:hypothetical protein